MNPASAWIILCGALLNITNRDWLFFLSKPAWCGVAAPPASAFLLFCEMPVVTCYRYLGLLFAGTLVLATLAFSVSLLDDDWGHVLLASKGIGFIFSTGWEGLAGQGGYYRPIVVLSLYANYLMAGFSPGIYHVTNLLVHAGCCLLVFLLGRRLELSDEVSWGGALMFFVLPLHTDTLFWIVGRTDSVCALFYLGALVLFFDYVEKPCWPLWAGLVFCGSLALLSKEMALSLPGVVLVMAIYRGVLFNKITWRAIDGVVLVFLGYFLIRQQVLGGTFVGTPEVHFSFWTWGRDVLVAIAKMGMTDLKWFGLVGLATTGLAWWVSGRRDLKKLLVISLAILVCLVPVLGHLQNWYLYLPSAFFCLAMAQVWLSEKRRVFALFFVGLLLYYAVVLTREGLFWQKASALSEAFVADMMPYAQATSGRLYVLNVPSAFTPDGSFGGKPLFAFALKNALAMRSDIPLTCQTIMVNHVWLTGEFNGRVTELEPGRYGLKIQQGGFFSFHDGQVYVPPLTMAREWGSLQVVAEDSMVVDLPLEAEDRVVVYTGEGMQVLFP